MLLSKIYLKMYFFVATFTLVSATHAQKLSDLQVTKDAKPGQWSSSGVIFPDGKLLPGSKAETGCISKAQLFEMLEKSAALHKDGSGRAVKQCPTIITTNTPSLGVLTMRCEEDPRMPGLKLELSSIIKRESDNIWVFSMSSTENTNELKTVVKYLGACSK